MANDNHYAVVVGVDQYPTLRNGTKDLNCPLRDAGAVQDWLLRRDGGGLPPGKNIGESPNLTLITRLVPEGQPPPRPVINEILIAILNTAKAFHGKYGMLGEQEQADIWKTSRLYLYFSGHGMDASGGDAVLLGAEAMDQLLIHLSVQKIVELFCVAKTFKEVVVWADCCRTASAVPIGPPPLDLTPYRYRGDEDVRVFFARASRTQKPSYEPPAEKLAEVPNSLFTHALLKGLEGAVPDADHGIRPGNLRRYLELRVPELSWQYCQADQAPDISPDDDMELVAARVPTLFVARLKVKPGSHFAGVAGVRIFSDVEKPDGPKEHPVAQISAGIFEARLPGGLYMVTSDVHDPDSPKDTFCVLGADIEKEI